MEKNVTSYFFLVEKAQVWIFALILHYSDFEESSRRLTKEQI